MAGFRLEFPDLGGAGRDKEAQDAALSLRLPDFPKPRHRRGIRGIPVQDGKKGGAWRNSRTTVAGEILHKRLIRKAVTSLGNAFQVV